MVHGHVVPHQLVQRNRIENFGLVKICPDLSTRIEVDNVPVLSSFLLKELICDIARFKLLNLLLNNTRVNTEFEIRSNLPGNPETLKYIEISGGIFE